MSTTSLISTPETGRTNRVSPATADGILRALRAGASQSMTARAYGVSHSTVSRIAARMTDDQYALDLDDLSELVTAEQELRQSDMSPGAVELLIDMVRVGHVLRKDKQRRERRAAR